MSPVVTVLIPARNEVESIGACLEAVLAQDFALEEIEVLVVDGGSTDETVHRAEAVLTGAGLGRFEVLVNPVGTTPSNLNLGLASAHGGILVRIDARSIVPPDYIRRCVSVLQERSDVVVVGGAQTAIARDDSAVALGIARALNNRWGMGLSRYRRAAPSGPADTVYLGAFRTDEVRSAGGWDERFSTNQDFELNRRLGRERVVWYESRLEVAYLPRRSLRELAAQYYRFGSWKGIYWRQTGERPQRRQVVLLATPVVGLVLLGLLSALPARWRRRGIASLLLLSGSFESMGPTGPTPAPVQAHLVSGVASAVVALSWLAGVYSSMLRHHR